MFSNSNENMLFWRKTDEILWKPPPPPFLREPPLSTNPLPLSNLFMTPLLVRILKTGTPLFLGGGEETIFTSIHKWQGCRGKGEGISLTPHCHFYKLYKQLDVSRAITADSSPLHILSDLTRTGKSWFPSVNC